MGEQADWEITKEIYGLDDDDILDFLDWLEEDCMD